MAELPRLYYPLQDAADLLDLQVCDLLHYGATGAVQICARLPANGFLCHGDPLEYVKAAFVPLTQDQCAEIERGGSAAADSFAEAWQLLHPDMSQAPFLHSIEPKAGALPGLLGRMMPQFIYCEDGAMACSLLIDGRLSGLHRAKLKISKDSVFILGGEVRRIRDLHREGGNGGEPIRPPSQQRAQEKEVLRIIAELGYTANALPARAPGKKGVKAEVQACIPKWMKQGTVFDKAWQRLRDAEEIKEA